MKLKYISIKSLESKYKKEHNARVKQRLQILLLLREGWTEREVANTIGVANGKVHFWKRRFESEGFEGLIDKKGRGLKPQLTEEELSMLASTIDEGIRMGDGYTRGLKTKDIKELISLNFSILYSSRHCQRIVRGFDCSMQVPRPRHKRRNQEDIDNFKEDFKKNEKVWAMSS